METNVFPPRVVTSRLMAMRSSIRRPGSGLTRASETSFDGRMYFARQEQRAPSPRQSLAIGAIVDDNCDKIFYAPVLILRIPTYDIRRRVVVVVKRDFLVFLDHDDTP
jgi:hypothetical protein